MAELWDIYDENGVPRGYTIHRGDPMKPDEFHIVVHVWLMDDEGRILLSRRSAQKESYPGMWEVTGGSVIAGETGREGAVREVAEELGIVLDGQKGELICRKKRDWFSRPDHLEVYLFHVNTDPDKVVFQPGETDAAMLADYRTIRKMIENGEFAGSMDELDLVFSGKN